MWYSFPVKSKVSSTHRCCQLQLDEKSRTEVVWANAHSVLDHATTFTDLLAWDKALYLVSRTSVVDVLTLFVVIQWLVNIYYREVVVSSSSWRTRAASSSLPPPFSIAQLCCFCFMCFSLTRLQLELVVVVHVVCCLGSFETTGTTTTTTGELTHQECTLSADALYEELVL